MDEALAFLEKEIRAFENILAELDGNYDRIVLAISNFKLNKYKVWILSIILPFSNPYIKAIGSMSVCL